jgi:septum formation protein
MHPLRLSGKLILGSASPRRKELLDGLGFKSEVHVIPCNETWPESVPPLAVAEYIASIKASAFHSYIQENPTDIILTADTTVISGNQILNKPGNESEAREMLRLLSGKVHTVATGVCLQNAKKIKQFTSISKVWVKPLSAEFIHYYVTEYQPFDKAGSYGIQEFFGLAAVSRISGCYYSIMGLPTAKVYTHLNRYFHAND